MGRTDTQELLLVALQEGGIEFIPENGGEVVEQRIMAVLCWSTSALTDLGPTRMSPLSARSRPVGALANKQELTCFKG